MKIFVLIVIANSIHPKLNTDEYLIISIRLVLFSWSSLPIIIDRRMNSISKYFVWNKIRNNGASFCQVINNVS